MRRVPEWARACDEADVPDGAPLAVECGGRRLLLCRWGGSVRAADAVCTHADADLSGGFLGPDGLRCPLHLSVFELECGRPLNPPAEAPLRTYNVKIDSGTVYVEV